MERTLFLYIFLISRSFAQIKDSETLIYYLDVHHEIKYYCQFGTNQEINQANNFEVQCLRRNRGMQHVLPDGVATYPYLSYISPNGFILKCSDIPNGHLHDCNRYVYSQCKYTCDGSNVHNEMKCELKGPKENVTAQWSVSEPCPSLPSYNQNTTEDTQDVNQLVIDPNTTFADILITTNTSPVSDNVTTTARAVFILSADNQLIIALTVPLGCSMALLFCLVLYLWLKRRKRKPCHKSSFSSHLSEDTRATYDNNVVLIGGSMSGQSDSLIISDQEDSNEVTVKDDSVGSINQDQNELTVKDDSIRSINPAVQVHTAMAIKDLPGDMPQWNLHDYLNYSTFFPITSDIDTQKIKDAFENYVPMNDDFSIDPLMTCDR